MPMIATLPQIAPVSDMRLHQADIIKKARRAPVILMERGSRPALVCIAPEMWDALAKYIDDLEATVEALEIELAVATGEATVEPVTAQTWEEIERNRERLRIPA
jgi:PHD/YefM family antitoxin component YafN of YafNO toxin-antitoxin module